MLSPQANARLLAALEAQRASLGLDSGHGFVIGRQHAGVDGATVTRVEHTFKGVRVFQSESVVVSGPGGGILSESVAERRAGLVDMDVTPSVGAAGAIETAERALAPGGAHLAPTKAELIIYPVMKQVRVATAAHKAEADLNALDLEEVVERYLLAWLVETRLTVGGKPVFYDTIVNAGDGSVIAQWSMVQTGR